jgi:D-aminopeptidase
MESRSAPRARDLGIKFEGEPGPLNAITDVPGVEVGHCTLIEWESVRTGVTAIHPRGKAASNPCFAGWFSLNGNGEMTGTTWIEESGLLNGSITMTNTHSVGVVRDAVIGWENAQRRARLWSLPVVAETYDGYLNDINGFHVKPEHVWMALDQASSGPVAEGCVGGGTGMICYGFKGGIGSASRRIGEYTVGVLVQANHGSAHQLRLPGRLVGLEAGFKQTPDTGSIIIIAGTDAPMLPHQCKALAKRCSMGLARTGAIAALSSGDIFLAFSTGNELNAIEQTFEVRGTGFNQLSTFFEAVTQATEEAIWNALVAATTMTGYLGHKVEAISHDLLRQMA